MPWNKTGQPGHSTHVRRSDDRRAKLRRTDVVKMRNLRKGGVSPSVLAIQFNIHVVQVREILCNESWTRVGGPVVRRKPYRKLTEQDVLAIRAAYARQDPPISQPTLGRQYGVSAVTIGNIVRGLTWKEAT